MCQRGFFFFVHLSLFFFNLHVTFSKSLCSPFLVICNMSIILSMGHIECPFFYKILRKRELVIPMFKWLKVVFKIFKKKYYGDLCNVCYNLGILVDIHHSLSHYKSCCCCCCCSRRRRRHWQANYQKLSTHILSCSAGASHWQDTNSSSLLSFSKIPNKENAPVTFVMQSFRSHFYFFVCHKK